MTSTENSNDLVEGPNGQAGNLSTDLNVNSDESKNAFSYNVEQQTGALINSFVNEKIKDDVIFDENNQEGDAKIKYKYYKEEDTVKDPHYEFIFEASCKDITSITSGELLTEDGIYYLKQYFDKYWKYKLDSSYNPHSSIKLVILTNVGFDEDDLQMNEITIEKYPGTLYILSNRKENSAYLILLNQPSEFTKMLNEEFHTMYNEPDILDPAQEFLENLIFCIAPKDQLLNVMSVIGIKSTNPEKKLEYGDFFSNTNRSEDDLRPLYEYSGILHFISDSTALAFIKVAQFLKNNASIVTYAALDLEYLLSNNMEIEEVLGLVNKFVLAVEIPKDKLMSEETTKITKVLDACTKIVCENNTKNMIIALIYNTVNKDTVNSWITNEELRSNSENTHNLSFTFEDLTEDSQKRIQETKVEFQGQDITLQEVLETEDEPANRYNELLTSSVLDKKISNTPLVIGNSLPGLTPEVTDCYVKRKYAHSNMISAQSIVDNFKGHNIKLNNFDNFTTTNKNVNESELDIVHRLLYMLESRNKQDESKFSLQLYPGKEFISQNDNHKKTVRNSTHFADNSQKKKKKKSSGQWLIEINLAKHLDALNAQTMSTMEDLIEFLVIAGKPESGSANLDKDQIIKGVREGNNLIVLLDALGKSLKKFDIKITALVEIMRHSKIEQIWIKTNPSSKTLFNSVSPDGKDGKEQYPEMHSTLIFNLIEGYDEGGAHMFTWENPDEDLIIGNIEARKIAMISGDPGTGKSVALRNIATKIKEKYPDYWVIQTSLNDHTDFLKKIKVGKRLSARGVDLIEFLSAAEGLENDSTNIGKKILTKRVKQTGKIIVLLDGLDEVCPLYQTQVVSMVNCMRKTKIQQIWITTRSEFQNVITTEHSYCLKDYKADDQKKFVEKYLTHLLKLHPVQKHVTEPDTSHRSIETFCQELYNAVANTINNSKLIGNALLARMTVEVYFNHIKKSSSFGQDSHSPLKAKSVSRLYEQFIKQRYCLHCEGKWKAKTSSAILNMKNKSKLFSTAYQRYAFQFLFAEKFKTFYDAKNELADLLLWDLITIGIISETSKNIHFFHRTFAEYYAAQYMTKLLLSPDMKKWKKDKKTLKAKNKVEFLTFEYFKENCKMIRNFMDHALSHGSDVHEAVLNDRLEDLEALVVLDKSVTRKRDKLGRTPLHLACSHKRKSIVYYLLKLDVSLIAELDNLEFGPACYAAIRGDEFFLKDILKVAYNYNNGSNEHLRHVLKIYNLKQV